MHRETPTDSDSDKDHPPPKSSQLKVPCAHDVADQELPTATRRSIHRKFPPYNFSVATDDHRTPQMLEVKPPPRPSSARLYRADLEPSREAIAAAMATIKSATVRRAPFTPGGRSGCFPPLTDDRHEHLLRDIARDEMLVKAKHNLETELMNRALAIALRRSGDTNEAAVQQKRASEELRPESAASSEAQLPSEFLMLRAMESSKRRAPKLAPPPPPKYAYECDPLDVLCLDNGRRSPGSDSN